MLVVIVLVMRVTCHRCCVGILRLTIYTYVSHVSLNKIKGTPKNKPTSFLLHLSNAIGSNWMTQTCAAHTQGFLELIMNHRAEAYRSLLRHLAWL